MAEDAWLQTPFATLASAPDSGLSWLLPRMIGVARAKRTLIRAERIDAATARDWGLVDETDPNNQLRNSALAVAREIADGRSEESRVGNEIVSTGRSRWSTYHLYKKYENSIIQSLHRSHLHISSKTK